MKLRDEKGAALVLTLLIITLLLLFITTLSGQVIQSTKQVTKMEERIDAELVSQMGVEYVQAVIEIYRNGDPTEENPIKFLNTYLVENLDKHSTSSDEGKLIHSLDNERQFEILLPPPPNLEEVKETQVTYTSVGTVKNQTVRTDDTITIKIQ